ncbi:MAG TPA: proline dehydrogenase family protein [Candidatus Nanopelagicales bacterium]
MAQGSLAAATHVTLGTHDHLIITEALVQARAQGWPEDGVETEMLYGVRPVLQADLVASGHRLRLYLPYGKSWFPYVIRRVGEAPRNLGFALRALLANPRATG